jgi:NADH-quinone oxidoreductase subunit I
MGYFTDSFRAVGSTLRNIFRPPVTVQYPKVQRPRTQRMRMSFALVHDEHGEEACIGCSLCERICPSEVIMVKAAPKRPSPVTGKGRGYLEDFTLNAAACIYCELCVQVCPTDAIIMTQDPETPGFSRADLFLTRERLYANEKGKRLTELAGSSLCAAQEPPKKPKPAPAPAPAATSTSTEKPGGAS